MQKPRSFLTAGSEVDDEYWDTFKQPPGKHSTISHFAEFIKLMDILAFAQRTLYGFLCMSFL